MNLAMLRMNLSQRQADIVDLIGEKGFVTVEALAERFLVTPQTIRRDVNALCDMNVLRRRHGGAELLNRDANLSYDTRRITHLAGKQKIAQDVARLVPNRSSLLIGIGTTPEQVALALGGHEDLTVVTNNFNAALALSANRSNRIIVPGGTLRLPDRDILGAEAEALFRDYRADFGIYGVGGIDEDGALLDFDRTEVEARIAIHESSRVSILVADVSKFGRQAPAKGGHLRDADHFVTDLPVPERMRGAMRIAEAAAVEGAR
jgi:DeoR family glycerol-3-phosphate regulon repressor